MDGADQVAFAAGAYEYAGKAGTATVYVPHDVMASEVVLALARLVGAGRPEGEKESDHAA